MMITELTDAQRAKFPDYIQEWIGHGTCTLPADRPRAEDAIRSIYRVGGKKDPEQIVWCESPLSMALTKHGWDSVRSSVGDSVWDSVLASVLASVGDSVGNSYSGALYASWGAFISFFRDIMLWEDACLEKFSIDEDLMKSCGWVWWHSNILAISDRPAIINRDDAGRLHCENGPSIAYRDGWALHHWHGVKVPAHWIENRSALDPKEVIKSENVEQRAAGAAIVGWPKMLSVLKAKVVNDSGSPDIGQLIELKLPGLDQAGRFLKAHCPRNGIIVEGVPRVSDIDGLPIDTALAAQAWRIGDPQSEYQHPTRRT